MALLKLSQLQKTKYDGDEGEEKEMNDPEYEKITDDNPILQHRDIFGSCKALYSGHLGRRHLRSLDGSRIWKKGRI